MEPLYTQNFEITDHYVDCFGRMTPASILLMIQEVAGKHCTALSVDYDTLAKRRMFWAVTRHRVQVSRMPRLGETIRVETWPMPTTRVAYPRSVVAYDAAGNECFRAISLWVLMNLDTRSMILPGKSGISVVGSLRGLELPSPGSLALMDHTQTRQRQVCFTDLDRNGHMNNTRYLNWVSDLLPSAFHQSHEVKEFTICYHAEAREGQLLDLSWDFPQEDCLQVDARRADSDQGERVFSARLLYR